MSSDKITSQFLSAMRQAGFEPDCTIVGDGRLHRFRDWLDKPGTLDGWYVLFPNFPPAGAFGCCRRGISESCSGAELEAHQRISKRVVSIESLS